MTEQPIAAPESDTSRWEAVQRRDRTRDGSFVYAVSSTGIYCRPSCPSRKPRRDRASFFGNPAEAEQAGFRACKRCRPDRVETLDPQVLRMREVCAYIEENLASPLTLGWLAERFDTSPSYLQRSFKRIVGISPRHYADSCRRRSYKRALRDGDSLTGALYEVGYGSASRVYADADAKLGMTPGSYRKGGRNMTISYGLARSELGWLLVAATDKGICSVTLGESPAELEQALRQEFSAADLRKNEAGLADRLAALVEHLEGKRPHLELPRDVRATAFQRQVWQALQNIPYGETRSYRHIAEAVGKPTATRAVASACARNPTALLVPCHRVVRSDGSLGGYRWGVERKKRLLDKEKDSSLKVSQGSLDLEPEP